MSTISTHTAPVNSNPHTGRWDNAPQPNLSHAVLDALAIGVAVLDPTGALLFGNKAWHDWLAGAGDYRELLLGGDYISEWERVLKSGFCEGEKVVRGVRAVLAGERDSFTGECSCNRVGALNWHRISAAPLLDRGGRSVVLMHADVTGDRLREQHLRQQTRLLDQTVETIIVRDLDDRIEFWNKGAERVFGWEMHEVIGKKAVEVMAIDPAIYSMNMKRLLEAGSWSGEMIKQKRDGGKVHVECHWTLLRDDNGAPQSILGIDIDLTEQKAVEAHLVRAQRLESLGTLAGGIAHDLNNILAPITMAAGLLSEMHQDEESQRIVAGLQRSAERGAAMVRQVLAFSRGMENPRAVISPARLLEEVAGIVRETFPRNVEFATAVPPNSWSVVGDPTQLHQVLLNLCVNARDAMPEGGKLSLHVTQAVIDENYAAMNPEVNVGPYVVFSVIDTGVGIAPEARSKIFELFYTTKPIGKGTGLGLSTSLAIIKAHHGFINFYSEVGKGTTFKVYLPAENAAANEVTRIEDTALPEGHGETILIVDDEEAVRDVCRRTLERHGYHVLTAPDGAVGIGVFSEHRRQIAAVITDMMMPIMDGAMLIYALRRIDESVRIIAASGLGSNMGLAKAANAGIKHFLNKPYSARALLKTVDDLLHNRGQGAT